MNQFEEITEKLLYQSQDLICKQNEFQPISKHTSGLIAYRKQYGHRNVKDKLGSGR